MARGVRKVRGGGRKLIGKFMGMPDQEPTDFESLLERDFCYLVAADPDVERVTSQPVTIRYRLDGKEHRYTPDYEVVWRGGHRQIVEVKCEAQAAMDDNIRKFRTVGSKFLKDGAEFLVVTETTIRQEPRLSNLKRLARYRKVLITQHHRLILRRFFRENQKGTLETLIEFMKENSVGKVEVYGFIAKHLVSIDLTIPLGPGSRVYSAEEKLNLHKSGRI